MSDLDTFSQALDIQRKQFGTQMELGLPVIGDSSPAPNRQKTIVATSKLDDDQSPDNKSVKRHPSTLSQSGSIVDLN